MANENELKKEEEKMLDEKELQLKQYHEKLKQENDKFKKEKEEFEAYKKIEKEKLEDELNEKRTLLALELEKLKTEEISKLRDGFADNIQKEYDKIRSKIDKLTQTELKLVEWQQELDNNKKIFQKDRELFDSQKEKLLNEYKSELEKDKEIFKNELEKDRVKKLEEINNTLDDLYRDKESKIKAQEDKLIEQEGVLKNKIAEVEAKEKALELEAEFIYNQEKEKVQEEVKFYQDKITSSETLNQGLKEEILDLREELNQYEKFEDRDLPHEIEEKRKEIDRLNNLLNETTNNKNKSMQDFDSFKIENKKKIDELYAENSSLIELNKETEKLRSEKAILEEKEMSYKNHIEFLKGENKDLNERLKSIYSDGTEIEERLS